MRRRATSSASSGDGDDVDVAAFRVETRVARRRGDEVRCDAETSQQLMTWQIFISYGATERAMVADCQC